MQRLRLGLRSWQALLLAVLLLAAQAAGLAHRVAHGGQGAGHPAAHAHGHGGALGFATALGLLHPSHQAQGFQQHAAEPAQAHGTDAACADEAAHGHAPGSAECRLVDQLLSPAGLLPGGLAALPPLHGARVAGPSGPLAVGLAALAAYQARAPPQA